MINVSVAPLSAIYLFSELAYDPSSTYNPLKPIKRWNDINAESKANPDVIDSQGNLLVTYQTYLIDKVSSTVKLRNFSFTVEEAKSFNIPNPKDTFVGPTKLKETPFPCRLLEQGEEAVIFPGTEVIQIRNIELWNKQQQQDSRSGFLLQDRQKLEAITNQLATLEDRIKQRIFEFEIRFLAAIATLKK